MTKPETTVTTTSDEIKKWLSATAKYPHRNRDAVMAKAALKLIDQLSDDVYRLHLEKMALIEKYEVCI